jgi:hypothetical protein
MNSHGNSQAASGSSQSSKGMSYPIAGDSCFCGRDDRSGSRGVRRVFFDPFCVVPIEV